MDPLLGNTAQQHLTRLAEKTDLASLTAEQQVSLHTLLALSDFIAMQLNRYPEMLEPLLTEAQASSATQAKANQQSYLQQLQTQLASCQNEEAGFAIIRRFRHQQMAYIAARDLLNNQTINTSLQQVSDLADAIILATYHWLYALFCQRYGTPQGSLGSQPLFIIGMGKLGGKELNFSSDIDLIFAYPEQGEITTGRKTLAHQTFFTRLGQRLISALSQNTVDGQAYRVDMRLRPFGDSGALVSHLAALEDYYQHQGREWERYAMVKGRVINSDSPYTPRLQNILRPFVYRRYIDFSVIDSLRDMKRLIQQEVRRRKLNHNIKLGPGGIRETEFIVQSFQLIRGGREIELQQQSLLNTLDCLESQHTITKQDAENLRAGYLFLRKVEHCLQQFDDQQTQDLPSDEREQLRLAWVMQQSSYDSLLVTIAHNMEHIAQSFLAIFGEASNGSENDELQSLQDLWALTFDVALNAEDAYPMLYPWVAKDRQQACFQLLLDLKADLNKKPIGTRGAGILNKLMPKLLLQLLRSAPKDIFSAMESVFQIITAIALRTAYLELLYENQIALQQLIRLCNASPWIAQQLKRFPLLLDELLDPAELYKPIPTSQYADSLRQILLRIPQEDLEQQMEGLRQFKLTRQLHIAAADVTGALSVNRVSDHLTALAEVIVAEAVNMAWQQMVEKYGYPATHSDNTSANHQNQGFAIIAYGKMGGIELGYGSDLDLVFLHNCPPDQATDGTKSIDSRQFYLKLSQRIIHIFTTKTWSGDLYDIDMRLRPSGNAGLLVSHINAFSDYQNNEAWTWEHQALVRSRAIYGDVNLISDFNSIRQQIVCMPRDQQILKTDIRNMREKMRKHLNKGSSSEFDLKQDVGGIADIEFLVQYWVLAYSHQFPELSKWSDKLRLLDSVAAVGIITNAEKTALVDNFLAYRARGHQLTLACLPNLDSSQDFVTHRAIVGAMWEQYLA